MRLSSAEGSIVDKIRKDEIMSEIKDEIILRGLKEHNLKNVDLNIPKRKSHRIYWSFRFRKEFSRFSYIGNRK